MMISSTPKSRSREIVISSSARPSSSTSAFGRSFVSGRSLVPSPAARIIAFIAAPAPFQRIEGPYRENPARLDSFREQLGLQLSRSFKPKMPDDHFHALFRAEVTRKLLRQKNRAVLPARATEGHHQIFEAPLPVIRKSDGVLRLHGR